MIKGRMLFYEENFQELLKNSVTAVFAVSDFYALEFMRFLQGKSIQIPNDIQIIGFDDNMASRESNPALTTIHQEASLRAKIAIECLEAILKSSWRLILLVHGASESHCVCLQHIYLNGILWGCIRCLPRKKYSDWLYR